MFEKTSEAVTRKLQENNTINEEQYEICRYGLQQGFTIILNVVTTLVIGMIMRGLLCAVIFMILYISLRSNAGGYHAKTAIRCYLYSILLMIAVLLAIKHIKISSFICIIIFSISISVICILAPIEDANKPLEKIEVNVYHKRTLIVLAIESVLFIISLVLNLRYFMHITIWVMITMSIILLMGRFYSIFDKWITKLFSCELLIIGKDYNRFKICLRKGIKCMFNVKNFHHFDIWCFCYEYYRTVDI